MISSINSVINGSIEAIIGWGSSMAMALRSWISKRVEWMGRGRDEQALCISRPMDKKRCYRSIS